MNHESSFAHAVVHALYQVDSVRSNVSAHAPPHSIDECAQCALVAGFARVTAAHTSASAGAALNKLLNDVSSMAPASDLAQVLRLCCAETVRVATRVVRDCGAVVRGSAREDTVLFAYAASLRRVQRLHAAAAAAPATSRNNPQYESTSAALWGAMNGMNNNNNNNNDNNGNDNGNVAPAGGQVLLSQALARVCASADEAAPMCDNRACTRRRACGVRRQWYALPNVFAVGLLWSSGSSAPLYEQPHVEDITMALWLIDHELRVDDIFECDPSMPRPSVYVLSVMLCNYGSRFVAFYKSSASVNTWIIYADGQTTTCGDWSSVFERCRREFLQPFVVLYEKPPLVPCDVCQAPLAPRMGVRLTVRGANERICSSCMTTIVRSLGVEALAHASQVVVNGAVLVRQRRRQQAPCTQCRNVVQTAFVDDADKSGSWLCTKCVLARVIPAGALPADADGAQRNVPRLTVTGAPVAASSQRGANDDAPAPTGEYLHLPSRPAGVESPRLSTVGGGSGGNARDGEAVASLSLRERGTRATVAAATTAATTAATAADGDGRVRRPRRGTAGDAPLTANVYGDLPRPAAAGRTPYWLQRRAVQYVSACHKCGTDLIFQPDEQMPVSVTCGACLHVSVFPPISAIEPALSVKTRPLPLAPGGGSSSINAASTAVVANQDGGDNSDSRGVSRRTSVAPNDVLLRGNNVTCVYCNALLLSPADDPVAANGACAVCEWRRDLAAVLEDDHDNAPPVGNGYGGDASFNGDNGVGATVAPRRNPRGGAYHELPYDPRRTYAALSTQQQGKLAASLPAAGGDRLPRSTNANDLSENSAPWPATTTYLVKPPRSAACCSSNDESAALMLTTTTGAVDE
jgi:hypothetical protein